MRKLTYDSDYKFRSFDLRLPGDRIKDKIIARAISKRNKQIKHLLEAGCGMGQTTVILLQNTQVQSISAFDFSWEGLQVARCNLPSTTGIFQADAQHLPLCTSFDCVIAKDLVEHLEDDEKFFSELGRVTSPAGSILVYAPYSLDTLNFSVEALVYRLTGFTIDNDVGHIRRYTKTELVHKLEESGFVIEEMFYFAHLTVSLTSVAAVWIYYHLLDKRRIKQENQPADTEHSNGRDSSGIFKLLLIIGFRAIELFGWLETWLFRDVPGAGIFVFATKAGDC